MGRISQSSNHEVTARRRTSRWRSTPQPDSAQQDAPDQDAPHWSAPELVAELVGQPERTVLTWAAKGLIASVRDSGGNLLVSYLGAQAQADEARRWWDARRAELGERPRRDSSP